MIAKSYIPQTLLKEFVEAIVFFRGNGTGAALQRMYQVIIFNMGDNFTVSELYAPRPARHEHTGAIWINGKQDVPLMIENHGTTAMYVVGVKPGMLPYLADLPACETNNLAVDAEHWTEKEIVNLHEQLLACPDIHSGFLRIEQYLTARLLKRDLYNIEKIKWLNSAIHTHRVNDICQTLGITRKKLRSETLQY